MYHAPQGFNVDRSNQPGFNSTRCIAVAMFYANIRPKRNPNGIRWLEKL
jgi:hypothetical protein